MPTTGGGIDMAETTRTLGIAFFSRKLCGEAAQFEIGLHRIPHMIGANWGVEWIELDHDDQDRNARTVADCRPDLLLLHANRDQMVETVAFVDHATEQLPDLPIVLCGWIAQPAYVDAVFEAAEGLRHPSFALACGEVEAIVPPLLERVRGPRGGPVELGEVAGLVRWDVVGRRWTGPARFVVVEDVDALPLCTIDHIPKRWRDSRAGWVELSRGCRLRCSFCFACCYRKARMRGHDPARVREAVRAAAVAGVEVLGLYTASVSLDVDRLGTVAAAFRELGLRDVAVVGAVGPIGRRFATGRVLEALSAFDWSVMTVGLQSITPEATRLARRPDDPETVARVMEGVSAFVTPELELILGLPGDSPEGFRRTVRFALSLPVNVTVQTFRLDPWSSYFEQREQLGLEADFRQVARVRRSPSFPEGSIEECRGWLEQLGAGPWTHRARALALDGRQLNDSSRR